jgi:TrmH family RNA methyltransferase
MIVEKIVPESSPLSKRKEALLRGLARKSTRAQRGSFLAEGTHVVEEALAGRWTVTDIVATPSALADIRRWQAAGRLDGVDVAFTDARTFRKLADSLHPQDVLGVVREPRLALADVHPRGPVLVFDRLQDPGNAGTLLRTLHATGGTTALALTGTVDLFNPKVVRASAGSLFHVEVVTHVSPADAVAWLEVRELPLFALDGRGEPLFGAPFETPRRFAIAVGNEGAGLAPALVDRAARRLAIPMARGVQSLNAAVAGSVALYELHRRRREADDRKALA